MDTHWLENLKENLPNYLHSLNKVDYKFLPVRTGLTAKGEALNLGFSCYALKIYYITNQWNNLTEEEKKSWLNFINSFQSKSNEFPINSFVDQDYVTSYLETPFLKKIRKYVSKSTRSTIQQTSPWAIGYWDIDISNIRCPHMEKL